LQQQWRRVVQQAGLILLVSAHWYQQYSSSFERCRHWTCLSTSYTIRPHICVYRKPWEHLAFGFAGAYAANWLMEMEEKMVQRIEDEYNKYSQPQAQ